MKIDLAQVRFVAAVAFGTLGSSTSCTADKDVSICADFDMGAVWLINSRRSERLMVPFANCAAMKPLKWADTPKVEAPPPPPPPPAQKLNALVEKAMAHASVATVPSDPELDDLLGMHVSKKGKAKK